MEHGQLPTYNLGGTRIFSSRLTRCLHANVDDLFTRVRHAVATERYMRAAGRPSVRRVRNELGRLLISIAVQKNARWTACGWPSVSGGRENVTAAPAKPPGHAAYFLLRKKRSALANVWSSSSIRKVLPLAGFEKSSWSAIVLGDSLRGRRSVVHDTGGLYQRHFCWFKLCKRIDVV